MKLFKCEVFIRTVDGLGINQNRTVYVVAVDSADVCVKVSEKFTDATLKTIEQIEGYVIA